MIVPTKHRGIHSDLFESLEKSCFFSTNLQFPLFFRIFAIARGAWWRSSFFSSSLWKGAFSPFCDCHSVRMVLQDGLFQFFIRPKRPFDCGSFAWSLGLGNKKKSWFLFFQTIERPILYFPCPTKCKPFSQSLYVKHYRAVSSSCKRPPFTCHPQKGSFLLSDLHTKKQTLVS